MQPMSQNFQREFKQKKIVFDLRQSLLVDACEQDPILLQRINRNLDKEKMAKIKNDKKQIASMVKSKLSVMFQQIPILNTNSSAQRMSMSKFKRRDSSLQVVAANQVAGEMADN